MEFISISSIIKKAPAKYVRAYLYTETDENDVTYFIVHQLEVIKQAIDELFVFLEKKAREIRVVEDLIKKTPNLQKLLNYRQIALLNRALKKPNSMFSVEGHRGAQNITYETARTDLLKLEEMGLLIKYKIGRAFAFRGVDDLKGRLESLSE